MKHLDLRDLNFPPALRLMLACLRVSPNTGTQIEYLSREMSDWPDFMGWWVRWHRVLPLVYTNLRRFAWDAVPESVRRQLQAEFQQNAMRGMANAAELTRVIRLLEDNKIAALAFKGPVLALRLYGDLSLRHAGDLDLLVDPDKVDRADEVLREAGYRCPKWIDFEMSPRQNRAYKRFFHHYRHIPQSGQGAIEMHWRLSYNRFLFPVPFGALQKRAQTQTIGGYPIPALSDEDMMLYLFVHGANHAWFRLFWLCDLAAACDRGLDWTKLTALGKTLGVDRCVGLGALLAHSLLGCPVPESILERRDSKVDALSRTVVSQVVDRWDFYHLSTVRTCRFNLGYLPLLRADIRYKLSWIDTLLLHAPDWRMFPLPDRLFPLYYVLRPLFWFIRKFSNRWS